MNQKAIVNLNEEWYPLGVVQRLSVITTGIAFAIPETGKGAVNTTDGPLREMGSQSVEQSIAVES